MRTTVLLAALLAAGQTALADTESVTMQTTDGITVHGEIYTAPGVAKSAYYEQRKKAREAVTA